MSSKWMIVSVAGLGWDDAATRKLTRVAGIDLAPAASVFPAVTCTAQASFRTAAPPRSHGMVANGVFDRRLRKASLWEQSSALVEGPRIWDDARAAGRTVGMFFWQQSLGETVDYIISPAPIHFHHGGMALETYTRPPELARLLDAQCGQFPLGRYWGPLSTPKVGDAIVARVDVALDVVSPDALFLYLPTLDYDLQRFGPDDDRCARSHTLLHRQIERLASLAEKHGFEMLVVGDYAIGPATRAPALPNVALRKAGLFRTRTVRGMAYPDLHASRAFALADHEVAHVYIQDPADRPLVMDALAATGDYESIEPRTPDCDWGHPAAGEILLTAAQGSWCAYSWWTDPREAPDYATHVDIHSKPGYDPAELFFGFNRRRLGTSLDPARLRGTHGRRADIAFGGSAPLPALPAAPTFLSLAAALGKSLAARRSRAELQATFP
ncbi:MAG: alkaline phosphatase family protein [Kiritimatiellia bacterium]